MQAKWAALIGAAAVAASRLRRRRANAMDDPFADVASALADILFAADSTGRILAFNRRWFEYTGEQPSAPHEMQLTECVHPDDCQRLIEQWSLAQASASSLEIKYRLRGADGRYRWFLARVRPLERPHGARWLGVLTNIDPQMRAEEALREREEQLRLALESTGLGIFEIEFWSGRLVWSDRCRQICGFETDAVVTDRRLRQIVHRDDRATVIRAINRSRDPRGTGEFSFEARILHPDQTTRRIAALGRSFFVTTADGERAIRCVGTMLDVTERKRAEEQLLQSEQRLELAQEASAVGMWDYDVAAGTLRWSRTLYRLYGRVPGAEPENTVHLFWSSVVPEDRERVQREVRQTLMTRTHYSSDYRVRRGDDSIRWISSRGRVERDDRGRACRFIGVSLDITEAKAAEQRLARSEELFRLAAEAVNGIIYDWDVAGGTVRRTRGLYEIIGYHPEQVPTSADWWLTLLHPDDRPRAADVQRRAVADGSSRMQSEYRVRHQSGHWVHVMDRSYLVRDDHGQLLRIVGCIQDVTELRRAERSLREADRRKDEFLAVLAHELRNPLAPIRSAVAIMRQAPQGSEAAAQARAILDRQVAHMVRLIDDLLDVGRITSGKLALRRESISLRTVIETAVETSRPLIDARGHALAVVQPERMPQINCDPARLSQVVANLLTNAAKYTPPGGHIRLTAEIENDRDLVLRVRDNGIGIAPDSISTVFEMFSQAGVGPGDIHAGLGVGLPLARTLTSLHGGTIEAASEGSGKGAMMTVRLPSIVEHQMTDIPPPTTSRSTAPQRVLVVDDNEDAAESLAALLRIAGHDVAVAYDGKQALDVAEQFRPSAVLLDVSMPRMDGHEAARRMRQAPWGKSIYIVALSGYGQEQDRARSLEAGCNAHLIKPVAPADLDQVMSGAALTNA